MVAVGRVFNDFVESIVVDCYVAPAALEMHIFAGVRGIEWFAVAKHFYFKRSATSGTSNKIDALGTIAVINARTSDLAVTHLQWRFRVLRRYIPRTDEIQSILPHRYRLLE